MATKQQIEALNHSNQERLKSEVELYKTGVKLEQVRRRIEKEIKPDRPE